MDKIKFGTDGWRAIIGDDYTVANLKRVAAATAQWLKSQTEKPEVVIGYDCRFNGREFSEWAARVLAEEGCTVHLSQGFASTPMVSLGVKQMKADAGVVITASHNPPTYSGFKIKGSFGGPALPDQIAAVEELIPESYDRNLQSFDEYKEAGKIKDVQLEEMYIDHVKANFDLEAIHKSGIRIAYDAMYGAGMNVIKRLLPDALCLHCEFNPSFGGTAPEPIMRNLQELSKTIVEAGDVDLGIATDGDADRIGMLDGQGRFVDSHHIILMLLNYLQGFKGMSGKVVNSFSCTTKVDVFCEKKDLEQTVTKVGFKHISKIMIDEDVLLGGEESGGIAIKGHIPERDGIWIGLTIAEYMAKEGKTLQQLIDEAYKVTGSFAMARNDLHISDELKHETMRKCTEGEFNKQFGPWKVVKVDDMDGYKFHFGNDRWLMIRPSGTEPVLRTYAQAENEQEAEQILKVTEETIKG